MKIWKSLTKWWAESSGGEWKFHCDFQLDPGEVFEIPTLGVKEVTPEGVVRKFHLEFCYHEEEELI